MESNNLLEQINELIPNIIKEPNEISQNINLLLELGFKIENHQDPERFKQLLFWCITVIKKYIISNLKLRYKDLNDALKESQAKFDNLKKIIEKKEKMDNQELSNGISLERQIFLICDYQRENLSKQMECQQIKNMKDIQIFIEENKIT